jgi:hypothetical protein
VGCVVFGECPERCVLFAGRSRAKTEGMSLRSSPFLFWGTMNLIGRADVVKSRSLAALGMTDIRHIANAAGADQGRMTLGIN